jgi:hypothetical protein
MTVHADLARELERVRRLRDELCDPLSREALASYAKDLEASLVTAQRVAAAFDELREQVGDRPA